MDVSRSFMTLTIVCEHGGVGEMDSDRGDFRSLHAVNTSNLNLN